MAAPSMRDRIRARAEDNKHTGGSSYIKLPEKVTFLKTEKGTYELDFVPYEVSQDCIVPDGKKGELTKKKGDFEFCRTILVHRKLGSENKPYLCPRTNKKKCPVCEYRDQLLRQSNLSAEDKKLAESLKPQVKDLFNVIDIKSKDQDVQVMEFSYANFREILENELRNGKDEWSGFCDLQGGYTLRVRFDEDTFAGNKFILAGRVDFEKRRDYKDGILDEVVDLDACLNVLSYDALKAILFGDEESGEPSGGTNRDEGRGGERDRGGREEGRSGGGERERTRDDDRGRGERTRDEAPPERERQDRGGRDRDRSTEDQGGREQGNSQAEGSSSRRNNPGGGETGESSGSSRRNNPGGGEGDGGRKEPENKQGGDGKCPTGHAFGADCENTRDCYKCPSLTWESCRDEKDRLAKG